MSNLNLIESNLEILNLLNKYNKNFTEEIVLVDNNYVQNNEQDADKLLKFNRNYAEVANDYVNKINQ